VLCVASSGGGLDDYRRIYLEGSQNVLNWLADSPPQKLVYTSSTSVYGQVDGSVVDETSPTEPTSPTSQILVQTENLLRQNQNARIPSLVLRLAGIYGPGRGFWLKQYLKGEARIEAGGARYLNMIHREDVVGATINALEIARPGEVFNVVDDEPVTQLNYFEWLSQRLRRDMPPQSTEVGQLLGKRGFTNKIVRNTKLKEHLHYCLRYPTFREGYEVEIRRLEQEAPLDPGTNDKQL
jgi:nucleoside-diphosphate-sugar epimerase